MKINEKTFLEERHRKILELIKEKERVTVEELSAYFQISGATIRSDLNLLAKEGRLVRTHGGAMYRNETDVELPIQARKRRNEKVKVQIGRVAAELVADGEVIFIDSSSTAISMIQFLNKVNELTVLTNSIDAVCECASATSATVIIPGGTVRRETLSVIGPPVSSIIPEGTIGKAFIGAWGFTIEEGLMDVNQGEIQMKKSAIEKTRSLIALVDSTKWGRISLGTFAHTEKIDTIITDDGAPVKMVAALRKKGIKVIIAGGD